MPPLPPAFDEEARRALSGIITDDAAERAEYGRDWTRIYEPAPSAVAFPRTTDEALWPTANGC